MKTSLHPPFYIQASSSAASMIQQMSLFWATSDDNDPTVTFTHFFSNNYLKSLTAELQWLNVSINNQITQKKEFEPYYSLFLKDL